MRLVTVKMPEIYVEGIEELVRAGRYTSRSEVIRIAVRELLRRELWSAGPPPEAGWLLEAKAKAKAGVG